MKAIFSNPIFIREKYEHDVHCDGEGWIHEINIYTGLDNPRPCKLCARMRAVAKKREMDARDKMERAAKDGENPKLERID